MGPNESKKTIQDYKDDASTMFGIVILLVVIVALMAMITMLNGAQSVSARDMAIAEQECASNGGVNYVDVNFDANDVRCMNGAHFNDLSMIKLKDE